jgi:hypothetical protein
MHIGFFDYQILEQSYSILHDEGILKARNFNRKTSCLLLWFLFWTKIYAYRFKGIHVCSGQPILQLGDQNLNFRGPAGYHEFLVKFKPCNVVMISYWYQQLTFHTPLYIHTMSISTMMWRYRVDVDNWLPIYYCVHVNVVTIS